MKKILVTGGAGFIGSHLVDRLLANGYKVICVDNFLLGYEDHLKNALKSEHFELHNFDLLEMDKLDALFNEEKFDIVYHLAANSDIQAGIESTNRDLQLTFLLTYNVLECMRKHNVGKILFTSSPTIFGNHNVPLTEDLPMKPESLYGASKLASEAYIRGFSSLYNIQAWILRLSNMVGERTTHGILYDFINKVKNIQSISS
jgi:UDP-glucose 4-epimerase